MYHIIISNHFYLVSDKKNLLKWNTCHNMIRKAVWDESVLALMTLSNILVSMDLLYSQYI